MSVSEIELLEHQRAPNRHLVYAWFCNVYGYPNDELALETFNNNYGWFRHAYVKVLM